MTKFTTLREARNDKIYYITGGPIDEKVHFEFLSNVSPHLLPPPLAYATMNHGGGGGATAAAMVVFKPRLHQDDDVANLILHDSRDPRLDSLANCEAAALLTRASHADIDVEYAPNDRLFSGELEKRVLSHHGCTPTPFATHSTLSRHIR